MEVAAHTFRVPEPEAHKLDDIAEAIRRQPAYKKVEDYVRTYPWRALAIALGLGIITARLVR